MQQMRLEGRLSTGGVGHSYGADFPMPSLLSKLAKPGCDRLGNQWDACGVYYAQPIDVKRQ